MQVPRISSSSYSNTAPIIWSFIYGSRRNSVELLLDTAPSRSAELLQKAEVDVAFVPVIAYQLIENLRLVPNVCVGAKEKVRSVCLVTKGEDLKNVKTVALDVSSKTSVALTKIIFREFLGFEPIWTNAKPNLDEMLENADCALLIGDPALLISDWEFGIADLSEPPALAGGLNADEETRRREDAGIQNFANNKGQRTKDKGQIRKFDLVELWREFTGCGFVFAMWTASIEKVEVARKIDFAAARNEGLSHVSEIISSYENEITLEREDFRRYLTENIAFSIDDSMQKGLELYFKLAHQNGLIAQNRELLFI